MQRNTARDLYLVSLSSKPSLKVSTFTLGCRATILIKQINSKSMYLKDHSVFSKLCGNFSFIITLFSQRKMFVHLFVLNPSE